MRSRSERIVSGLALALSVFALVLVAFVWSRFDPSDSRIDEVEGALSTQTAAWNEDLAQIASDIRARMDALSGRIDRLEAGPTEPSDLRLRLRELEAAVESLQSIRAFLDQQFPDVDPLSAVAGELSNEGRFDVLRNGILVGREIFRQYRSTDRTLLTSTYEGDALGWVVEASQIMESDLRGRPVSYRAQGHGPDGSFDARVFVRNGEVDISTILDETLNETVLTSPDAPVILDPPLFSQFALLFSPSHIQTQPQSYGRISSVTPHIGASSLTVSAGEAVGLLVGDETLAATRYALEAESLEAWVYRLEDGTLVGVEIPSEGLFAYRSDRYPEGFQIELRDLARIALPATIGEMDLVFSSGGVGFSGTLTFPADVGDSVPIVLLIPDAGPVDRNGNMPGLQTDLLSGIAHDLAQVGIPSYRFDPRGVGQSGGDNRTASMEDYLTDARVALALMKALPFVDQEAIYAFGHGLGAAVGESLAAQGRLHGLILLGAPAVSLDVLLLEQAEVWANVLGSDEIRDTNLLSACQAFVDFVQASQGSWSDYSVDALKERLASLDSIAYERLVDGPSLGWWREQFAYDPTEIVHSIDIPVLILHGEDDHRVSAVNADRLATALRDGGNLSVELHVLDRLNHYGRTVGDAATPFALNLNRPIDARLVSTLTDWFRVTGDLPEGGSAGPAPIK